MNKILIIDDDLSIRKLYEHSIKKRGYITLVAEDGKKGLELLEKETPDIALLDMTLPEMDGLEILHRIKEISKEVEVIMITGEDGEQMVIQALRSGAFDYFKKPVNFDELDISIKNALEKQRTHRLLDEYVAKLKTVVAEKTREINLRKEADKRIKHLASFPEQSFDPILEVNTSGSITYFNTATTNTLEKLGINADINIFLPKDMPEIIKIFTEHKGDTMIHREVKIGDHTFKAHFHLIHELNVIRIFICDITDYKKAEQQIHKLFTAVEQSPSSVLITDIDGNIEYVNPKFSKITGYSAEEVIGKNPSILKSGKQPPEVYQKLWSTIVSGMEWYGELHNKKKNGELFCTYSSIFAIKNAKGAFTNYINVSEDITRRKLAEDELIEARDKLACKVKETEVINDELQLEIAKRKELEQTAKLSAVGKLAAGIAHEINNPLSFIYANLENLNKFTLKIKSLIDVYDEQDMPEETRKTIEVKKEAINYGYLKTRIPGMIEKSIDGADRMKKIVMDMKTFARVDRAKIEVANINDAIETTLGILVHEYKNRIEIKKDYDEQLPPIKCFIAKLNQVFLNILINACQAIEGKGVMLIKTSSNGGNAMIEIEDNGSGIPDDVIDKIFNPFFTTKPVGQGTGLGLSICHEIIQEHSGELSVKSSVGKGTTFNIKLPYNHPT